MTIEEVLSYLKENTLEDITPEDFVYELFQNGELTMADYLELQKAIEIAKQGN